MGVLTDDKLIDQLARHLDVPRGEAERLLHSTVGLLKSNLLQGHQLDLQGFLSLQVVEEKARIVQRPDSPARTIEPPRNTIVTTPLPSFEHELAHVRLTPILLVVPQNDFFADIVEYHFTQAGWNVALAHEPDRVTARFADRGSLLVILDISLPGAQALLEELKVGPSTNTVPLIALFPRGQRPSRPATLRVQADQELVEPFEVAELLACAERELVRSAEEELLFDQQVRFVFPSARAELDRATDLARDLLAATALDAAAQTAFHAAIREAMGNAIQHGGHFDPATRVQVQYLVDPQRVTVIVRDEGSGFDHRRYLARAGQHDAIKAARDRHAEGGRGGLGILMMSRAADRVEYNDKGTVVTLTRSIHPRPRLPVGLDAEARAIAGEIEQFDVEMDDDLYLQAIDDETPR